MTRLSGWTAALALSCAAAANAVPGEGVQLGEVMAPPGSPSAEKLRTALFELAEVPDGCAAS